ncbi:MAG TPA: hypothetical protein VGQ34_10865 [Sphingomicrobium sp.]|nr:hypothetical protein [Sphingomicrobium sp.]
MERLEWFATKQLVFRVKAGDFMDLKRLAQIIFAVTMTAVGLIGLIRGSFAAVWGGVPETLPARESLVYLCALVAIATGIGMFVKRTAAAAALGLLIYFSLWTIAFKVPAIVRHPLVEGPYQSFGENAVLIAAAWALYAHVARDRQPNFLTRGAGLRSAYVLYGLALLAFGFSHIAYPDLTIPLVPKWMLWPALWAYLTAAIYVATGVGLITGFAARSAARLAAVQITVITVLVWGPMVASGDLTPGHLGETIESSALTAGALVLAMLFRTDSEPSSAAPDRQSSRISFGLRIPTWSSRRS